MRLSYIFSLNSGGVLGHVRGCLGRWTFFLCVCVCLCEWVSRSAPARSSSSQMQMKNSSRARVFWRGLAARVCSHLVVRVSGEGFNMYRFFFVGCEG